MVIARRLGGWKSIAAHLGVDVTTAIRWERTRGLPVRSLPGGRRRSVFVYETEIKRWSQGVGTGGPGESSGKLRRTAVNDREFLAVLALPGRRALNCCEGCVVLWRYLKARGLLDRKRQTPRSRTLLE